MAGWNWWNRIIYALWSPVYDWMVSVAPLARARREALARLDLQAGAHVLVVGVGTGADLALLPAGVRVTGVDLSRAMLAVARRKLPLPDRDVQLLRANAESLPLGDGCCDTAVLTLILSVAGDGRACLREAVRVVRAGGRILVFDKFLPAGRGPSPGRWLLNLLTRPFGTDINRHFEPMMEGLPCRVVRDEAGLLSGAYRTIVLEKAAAGDSLTGGRDESAE